VRVFRKEAESFAAEVRTDVHGNVDVVVNPGGSPRVMLAGHYDEIGFIVTLIDARGYLWISPIGGWDAQIPQGQRVSIRTAKGVVPASSARCPSTCRSRTSATA
jgi:tetrahedral aminopeptidase